jgi:hypothetical protein
MADVKISGLPASTVPLAGTEVLPIVQGGQTRQVSVNNLTTGKSVSATSFVPSGATIPTNGLYLPAANNVALATNTTERLRLTSGGNLGLGTTDPDYGSYGANERILGVTGVATNRARISLQNTSTGTTGVAGTLGFFNGSTLLTSLDVVADGATNSGRFAFYTNSAGTSSEKMTLNRLGYLGIGSNNPSALLHIEGNIATPVTEIIRNSSADTAAGGKISFQYTTTETGYLYNRFNGADFETQLQAAQQIIFKTGTTEQMRVANTGNVTVSTGNLVIGTSGKGIDFSATAGTGTSELLADYEEGTWSPLITNTIIDATMAAGTFGTYTKIGRLVTCQIYVETTNLNGIIGGFYISGWPFAINKTGGACASAAAGLNITAGYNVTLRPWASTLMRFYNWDVTTGTSDMPATEWSDDGSAFFTVSYEV